MPARKWCFVPKCTNTSMKSPLKIFVTVPKAPKIREKWFTAARRNIKEVSPTSAMYCCEDHFDLEEDMENYMEYKLSKVKARMKLTIVPHKFACQPNRNLLTKTRQFSEKRARKKEMLDYLDEFEETITLQQVEEHESKPSTSFTIPKMYEKLCQTNPIHFRSKYVQTSPKLGKIDTAVSTYKTPYAFQAIAKSFQKTIKCKLKRTKEVSSATAETLNYNFYSSNQSSQSTEDIKSEIDIEINH